MRKIVLITIVLLMMMLPLCMTASAMSVDKVVVTVRGSSVRSALHGGALISVFNGEDHAINAKLTITSGGKTTVQWSSNPSAGVNVPGGDDNSGYLSAGSTWTPGLAGVSNFGSMTVTLQAGNLMTNASSDKITVTRTGFMFFGIIFMR